MVLFKKMAYEKPSDIIFGSSERPLKYGLELSVGKGIVIPEVKYWPRSDEEKDEKIVNSYSKITKDILKRATNLGMESLQLETELSFNLTLNPSLTGEIVRAQKEILEDEHSQHGINLGLRATVADVRGMRSVTFDGALDSMYEAFDQVSRNGVDVISIESICGKGLSDHAISRGEIEGVLFALGVLSTKDMSALWSEITKTARRNGAIPGGDSACGFANTAMMLANGLINRGISHVFAALVRAMSASRSLVAYESGAIGPGKDCGYENVIIKAITGYPMSMEGKTAASAHSSLIGNISAATCDLLSNEQIENIKLFGGTGPQTSLEMLHYDTRLMNKSKKMKLDIEYRDLMISSDMYTDPQGFVISPTIAYEIGREIISYSENPYTRTLRAGIKFLELLSKAIEDGNMRLDARELAYLDRLSGTLKGMPEDEDEFIEKLYPRYETKISKEEKDLISS